jgi:outer membrane protein OmpA-like peptidoglycan-associated protein
LGRFFALIFAALFLIVSAAWLTGVPHPARQVPVIRQWDSGIRRLGITPVFPPREDIQIGDLFLAVGPGSADGKAPTRERIWLADLGLASPIADFYKNRFAMPAETGEESEAGRFAPPAGSTEGIFKTGAITTRLRSVSFPGFPVLSDRSAKPSVADSLLHFFRAGSFSDGDYDITISISDGESYGIPALTALDAIAQHCVPSEKLKEILKIYGLSEKTPLEVVTDVYYARSIDYTVTLASGFGRTVAVTPADLEKIKNLVTQLGQQKLQTGGAKTEASVPETGLASASSAPAKPPASANATLSPALAEAITADLDRMSAAIEGPNAPAVSGAAIRSDARSITLRQQFAQPVAIGYQSVPYVVDCKKPPPLHSDALPPHPLALPISVGPRTFLVYFDWDRYQLTPRAMLTVVEAARYYQSARPMQIRVTGYTDLSGSPDYNQPLSEHRAGAVATALAGLGVPHSDMVVVGRGIDDPRIPTACGVREPENRRVEIYE